MNLKNKTETENSTYLYTVYPKEYAQYIFGAVLISICSLLLLLMLFTGSINSDTFHIFFGIDVMWLGFSGYTIITSYMLIKRKIFIEVAQNYIKLKGVFKTKMVRTHDIVYIGKKTGLKSASNIILKCDLDIRKSKKTDLIIPVIWFSHRDMMRVVNSLKHHNKAIKSENLFN